MYEKYLDKLLKTSLFYNMDREEIIELLNCIKPKVISYSKNSYITVAGYDFKCVG
ncbi:MAG TPA: Crp/Fnr family transcriptional regulator, partial [Clostridiaceae bacterium]|nr:Crp/Fnr family transcriptional regulator [Clostridiaceae bacterium]